MEVNTVIDDSVGILILGIVDIRRETIAVAGKTK